MCGGVAVGVAVGRGSIGSSVASTIMIRSYYLRTIIPYHSSVRGQDLISRSRSGTSEIDSGVNLGSRKHLPAFLWLYCGQKLC